MEDAKYLPGVHLFVSYFSFLFTFCIRVLKFLVYLIFGIFFSRALFVGGGWLPFFCLNTFSLICLCSLFVFRLSRRTFNPNCQPAGWLAVWLFGCLVDWSVGRLVGWQMSLQKALKHTWKNLLNIYFSKTYIKCRLQVSFTRHKKERKYKKEKVRKRRRQRRELVKKLKTINTKCRQNLLKFLGVLLFSLSLLFT